MEAQGQADRSSSPVGPLKKRRIQDRRHRRIVLKHHPGRWLRTEPVIGEAISDMSITDVSEPSRQALDARPGQASSGGMKPTNISNPDYFQKVVDCQWACPAHTPVPEYI